MVHHDRRTFLRAIGASGIGALGSAYVSSTGAAQTTITVEGGGDDVWNAYDEFHYYYEEVSGDFDVTVRVDSQENTGEWARAGLMVRQSLADDEEHAMIRKTPEHETSFQWRSDDGAQAVSTTSDGGSGESEVSGGTTAASWQRLVRSGDTIEAYGSTDGSNWTLIADISPGEIDFADSAYVGLAVCSYNSGTLCTAEFSNLSGLSPSSNADVGNVDVSGSVSESTDDTSVVVSTGSASNETTDGATVSGSLDDLGGASSADVSFEFRETGASSWTSTATQTLSGTGSYSETLSGLSSGADYEFRAVAAASDGDTDTGSTNTFSTATDSGGSGVITVDGAGADIWNEADEGHYYFAQVSGDFDVTVRVDSQENTDSWAKAGFMIRESLSADAVNAMIRKTPGNETSLQWRESAGADTTSTTSDAGSDESEISGGTMVADYQRLVRNGDVIEAYGSADGSNWTLIADLDAARVNFSDTAYLGLAVTSHDTGTLCTTEFSELSGVSPTNNQDIGSPDVSGSVTDDSGGSTDPEPIVTTGAASNVDTDSATLSGSLDDLGDASSADVAFEYRQSGASTWTSTAAQTLSTTGSFSETVSGLSSGTGYEFRATVTASDGDTDVGSTATFSTSTGDTAPSVTTGTPSNVGTSSATLSGSLDDLGSASSADAGFEYREAGSSSWTATATQTLSSTGTFSEDVSGLASGTDHEFRATVTASDGDADTGATNTFSTSEDTGDSGSISVEGAGADIWNEADEGHYYFTDVRGDFDVTVAIDSLEDTDSWAKAGLHFRETLAADAKNAFVRKTPGNDSSFSWRSSTGGTSESTTSDGGDVSQIDGGSMAADYQRLVRSGDTFQAYLSSDGSNWTLAAELSTVDFTTDGYLGLAVTSANTGTLCTAEFSELSGVALTNNQDLGSPDVSGSVSGGTGDEPLPLVSTGSATDIQDTSATLTASLDSLGDAASADVSFEYRENGASAWNGSASQTLSSTGTFSESVSGLSTDTEYEYRAVADASDGDSDVGLVETVTTRPPDTAPVVSTDSATDVASSSATLNGSLDDLGGAFHADVSFEYRESGTSSWTETASQRLESTGSFSQTEFGLTGGTDYEFRAVLDAEDGDADTGSTVTFATDDAPTGGSHVDYEDGFADVSWFDDSVQVMKVGANLSEIQDAFTTDAPRLIVFEESGVVDLAGADLSITYGNCWVAGQTAPSPGITFINGMVQVEQDNTIVQHIRVFRGDESGGEGTDPVNSRDGTQNVIFDHVTSYWGRDENLSVGYDSVDQTVSNCLVAEGLEDPEENSNGTLIGDNATNVAIMGTVYAKNNDRNPRHKDGTVSALANNLVYYFDKASWLTGGAQTSVVGCGYIGRFDWSDAVVWGDGSAYFDDNFVTDPGLEGRDFQNVSTEVSSPPIWPSGFEAMPSGDVESHNLTYAGCRPADRVDHEQRVIDEIANRSLDTDVDDPADSEIPNSHTAVGGHPDHGGATHTLDVPDSGLKNWIDQWALAVEEEGVSPPGGGSGGGGDGGDTDPVVTTDSASDVDSSSATLNGSLDDLSDASSADVYFEWRDTSDSSWSATAAQTLSATGSFSETVSGLSSGTNYEFRAVADASDGDSATGTTSSFSTSTSGGGGGSTDGAYFHYEDGFADTSWFDDGVDVYTIQNATRSELENALTASGARLVVFETSGTIDLSNTELEISNDRCWVAGQTAPSPGITLIRGQFQVNASDCVVQHVRSRIGPGDGSIQSNDAVNTEDGTTNNVFDHVTATWGVDECMSVGYNTDRTTFANCLIGEGLYSPYGDNADHNYSTLVGDGADNVALLGNVWSKTRGRIPRLKDGTRSAVVNNFTYFFDESANADGTTSFVGNGYTGLTDNQDPILDGGEAYVEDNYAADPPLDGQSFASTTELGSRPLWPSGLAAMPSSDVENHNLNYAGARPADRSQQDQRLINEIANRAGNDRLDTPYDYWLADHTDVGGYPSLPENTRSLNVPDSGLRDWLEQWALAVEEADASPP